MSRNKRAGEWSHIGLRHWLKRRLGLPKGNAGHVELAFCGAHQDCDDCVLRPVHGSVLKAFKVCTRVEACSAKVYNDVVVDGSKLWC